MHEYSIVQALVNRVEREARARRAVRVHGLSVSVGELSGVEIDLLRNAYDICRGDTVCDEARLELTRVAARWACSQCARDVVRGGALRCPACGAPARLAEGGEILLDRIEMEVPDV